MSIFRKKQFLIKLDIANSTAYFQNLPPTNTIKLIENLRNELHKLISFSIDMLDKKNIYLIKTEGDACWLISNDSKNIIEFSRQLFIKSNSKNLELKSRGLKEFEYRISVDYDEFVFYPKGVKTHTEITDFISYAAIICSRIELNIKSNLIGLSERAYNKMSHNVKSTFGGKVLIDGKNQNEKPLGVFLLHFDKKSNDFVEVDNGLKELLLQQYLNNNINTLFIEGKNAVQELTKFMLESKTESISQTHFLSNIVPEKDDFLIKLSDGKLKNTDLKSYSRIIGITEKEDVNFTNRSIQHANIADQSIEIKAINTISLSNYIDRFPNFVVTKDMSLITFPSKVEDETFALFFKNSIFTENLKSWFDNFSRNIPLAQSNIKQLDQIIERNKFQTIEWVINIIKLKIDYSFKDVICITLMGSFSDRLKDLNSVVNDVDLLIVFKKINLSIYYSIKNILEEICEFFSNDQIIFSLNMDEGPVHNELVYKSGNNLIHVLLNEEKSIINWPSQIKRTRFFQHEDKLGNFKNLFSSIPEINRVEYLGDDFGFNGLRTALEKKKISYKTWKEAKRAKVIYQFDSPFKIVNFSIYSILRSAANYLDLFLKPNFYNNWNGSNALIQSEFLKLINNEELKSIYKEAVIKSNEIRIKEFIANSEDSEIWRHKALIFLTIIIEQLKTDGK